MNIQIWQHKTSGDKYVVEVDGPKVLAACGPLHFSEVNKARLVGGVNPDPDLAEDMNENEDIYRLVEE